MKSEQPLFWAELIERFLNKQTSKYEWDDYLHLKTHSQLTEKIRGICGEISFLFPEDKKYCSNEGEQYLRALAKVVREGPEKTSSWVDAFIKKFNLISRKKKKSVAEH
ncbi:MAG: hypothetical protein LBH01_06060 [Verrucomicrobiales bacterium]|jgi:hypothetical protein|nr:hypothetical protein [Verrucomicrobiales bacterium]